jgi:hypothetical protein
LIARGLLAIHHKVIAGLAGNPENSQVGDPLHATHDFGDLLGLILENVQVFAVNLGGKLSLDSADRFFHVVGDGLGKAPHHPRQLR